MVYSVAVSHRVEEIFIEIVCKLFSSFSSALGPKRAIFLGFWGFFRLAFWVPIPSWANSDPEERMYEVKILIY